MAAVKPTSSFPIRKITFQHQRSVPEQSFVRSQASNSESLREMEDRKEEARLAAREAARLAARGHHGYLLGEEFVKQAPKKKKNGGFKWKMNMPVMSHDHSKTEATIPRVSPQPSLQEDEELSLSLGWTQASTSAGLTTVMEDGTASKSSRSKGSKGSKTGSKFMKKKFTNKKQSNEFKMPQTNDMNELAKSLSASGAFACSICGTIYDSLANATRHEEQCLICWIDMMERTIDDSTARALLKFPAEHRPQIAQSKQVSSRPGLQRNGVSFHSAVSAVSSSSATPSSALSSTPRYKQKSRSSIDFIPPKTGGEVNLESTEFQRHMIITDKAVVDIVQRSKQVMYSRCQKELSILNDQPDEFVDEARKASLLLKLREFDAQHEIALMSRDRHYYGMVEQRSLEKIYGPSPRYENPYKYYYNRSYAKLGVDIGSSSRNKDDTDKASLLPKKSWNTVKHRFEHAYELIKEGPCSSDVDGIDHIKKSKVDKNSKMLGDIKHGPNTLYINVVVKNSVQVVNNELQRMARGWWQSEAGDKAQNTNEKVLDFQFEWIRAHTQKRVIQLAAVALASDFTPRKVAVQLSNDLYRLMGPQLENRGVGIQTEIEYRSGQYFVLAVNVHHIDWIKLFDHTAKQLARERRRWIKEQKQRQNKRASVMSVTSADAKEAPKKKKRTVHQLLLAARMRFPSRNEVVAHFLAFMNHFHFIITLPLVNLLYYLFAKYMVDKYILTVVTDDIFRYVEKKGMEMQLEIKGNNKQASFMLAALRELREDDKKRKELEDEGDSGEGAKSIVGPLLGPMIKEDAGDAKIPADFDPPDALEFEAFEVDLPVGFLRLRWALLNHESKFWKDAFFVDIMKYDNITDGKWSSHEKEIGLPKTPDGIDEGEFLNATLEFSYLMPKSAFVKANTCYATHEIIHYDENCFVIKEKTLTPEVPYGNTFVAWTQYSIVNTGKNTCRLECSVEAEFPNGPPMVARQIKSGMRSGTSEKFVLLGETICRYADATP